MLKILSITLLASFSSLMSADIENGKTLFDEQNCVECHSLSKFFPKENKVTTFDKLHAQVQRCSTATGASWFEEDAADVSHYLNTNFYHFKVQEE